MSSTEKNIQWPNNQKTTVKAGESWLIAAQKAGVSIPTGCLSGSCGACEIEVNGEVVRACISLINNSESNDLKVDFSNDPYW